MWALLIALLVAPSQSPSVPPPLVSIQGTPVYVDASRDVSVQYAELPWDTVTFTSHLPQGWAFSVNVDGNMDGMWGSGHGMPDASVRTSPDRSFGREADNKFCAQYVFTSLAKDPNEIEVASGCGDLPSKGRAVVSNSNLDERSTMTLEIPADEIFSVSTTAHVQVCLWDTARWHCEGEFPNLLVLTRSLPGQSPASR